MRVLTTLTLLVAVVAGSAVENIMHQKFNSVDYEDKNGFGLTQILTSTLGKLGPKEMTEPAANEVGTTLTLPFQVGGETTVRLIEGKYVNTTRTTKDQSYLYMWKHACAFSKWVPTNQFLHANLAQHKAKAINFKEFDLSRFGFIGSDKQCYWGLIAVHWIKPLPVSQQLADL